MTTVHSGILSASCVRRGWISREIQLDGISNVVIRYDGSGAGESVFVDGELAGKSDFHTFNWDDVAPSIDFVVPSSMGELAATIEVSARLIHLLRISKFKLTIGGLLVYDDRKRDLG
jgi:hypothetical protein